MEKREFVVEGEFEGFRLDKYLSEKLKDLSRSYLKNLIRKEKIKVNGLSKSPSYSLKKKDLIEVFLEKEKSENISLIRLNIPIIYEDEDIVVVDKPQGVIVHPVKGGEPSVVGDLILRDIKLSSISLARPGVVHRLDKATSGVMVLAKNNLSHLNLLSQFRERKIVKEYFALVEGVFKEEEGIIELPLKRFNYKPKMKVSFIGAKKASTSYKVLERKANLSYLLLKPKTGRMHQLRVHLSFLGHPIIGDTKYGGRRAERLFLHSHKLGLFHPKTQEFMEFVSPLPSEFRAYLKSFDF